MKWGIYVTNRNPLNRIYKFYKNENHAGEAKQSEFCGAVTLLTVGDLTIKARQEWRL